MGGFRSKAEQVARLAGRQHGVVARAQLLELGLGEDQIDSWVRTGRLHRRHRAVFAVGRPQLDRHGEWLAAVWACGRGAVLSHTSAAALHGMAAEPSAEVHVTTTRSIRPRPGLVIHRTRHLPAADVVTLGPIAVTRVPRTILDAAAVLPFAGLRALADAQRSLDLQALRAARDRAPGHRGGPAVARLLAQEAQRTRSAFERRFLRFAAAHDLPRPDATNVRVAGHQLDVLYAGPRLVVELDGRAHHARRDQMRQDRRRDADLQLAGLRVLRLVWEQLDRDRAAETAGLLGALLRI